MCKQLSERAAHDLIAFVRSVLRDEYRRDDPHHSDAARKILAKHGLLTPADDPEVVAVFMEEESARKGWHSIACAYGEHSVCLVPEQCGCDCQDTPSTLLQRAGSLSRFYYSETKE